MSEPTIYFPENARFELTFQPGRMWNTQVAPGPTGRRQSRKMQIRPKRQMRAMVYMTTERGFIVNLPGYGNNDPGSGPPKLTNEDMFGIQMRPFLDQASGRYQNFFVFDPVSHFFHQQQVGKWNGSGLPLPVTFPGDLWFTLPFRGDWPGLAGCQLARIFNISLHPVVGGPGLGFDADHMSLTTVGAGQETAIVALDPSPAAGDYDMYITYNGHERIPAVMVSDRDDFTFDTQMEEPWKELTFELEEDFG